MVAWYRNIHYFEKEKKKVKLYLRVKLVEYSVKYIQSQTKMCVTEFMIKVLCGNYSLH